MGVFLLIQLCIIAAEGLRRRNLSSIASSVHRTPLGAHQTATGFLIIHSFYFIFFIYWSFTSHFYTNDPSDAISSWKKNLCFCASSLVLPCYFDYYELLWIFRLIMTVSHSDPCTFPLTSYKKLSDTITAQFRHISSTTRTRNTKYKSLTFIAKPNGEPEIAHKEFEFRMLGSILAILFIALQPQRRFSWHVYCCVIILL